MPVTEGGDIEARIAARAAERRRRSSRHAVRPGSAPAAEGGAGAAHRPGARHSGRSRQRSWPVRIARYVALLAFAAVLTLLLRTFGVQPFWIPCASMEPTLHGCHCSRA